MASEACSRSTADWEIYIGQQFRTMRVRIPLEQNVAALRANASMGELNHSRLQSHRKADLPVPAICESVDGGCFLCSSWGDRFR